MADETYQPKVYMKQGGDEQVVASGGAINIETGGAIKANGTQAGASANLTHSVGTADGTVDDVGSSFNQTTLNNNFKECSSKINAILAALRGAGIIAS